MNKVIYEVPCEQSENFDVTYNSENQILSLINPADSYQMNWTRGREKWGTIVCALDLSVRVTRKYTEKNTLLESFRFCNETDFDIYTMGTELGIYTPFPDYYTDAAICLTRCCHTHIWCGGNSSYIMALRMGGEAPNLGMVLRKGSLQGYSVERMTSINKREEELSNHRGDFILHPENLHLRPGETYTLSWELFWFENKKDFLSKLMGFEDFVYVASEQFVLFSGEKLRFEVKAGGALEQSGELSIQRKGRKIPFSLENGCAVVEEDAQNTGEYYYEIYWKEIKTNAVFLVMPKLEELADKRCQFLVEHQQCHDGESRLNGAFLIYDNEEKQQYYGHRNDHNGGRERLGMGLLLAVYLKKHPNQKMHEALKRYLDYIVRELFDVSTGTVFNDVGRNMDTHRLYNYPWVSRLFLEMYHLEKKREYLIWYCRSMEAFYQAGGGHFYAIGIPMYESVRTLNEAGMKKEAEELLSRYKEHGDFIVKCGKNYPAHEVDYEQSIVAPAAIYMCELYHLTGEEKYRKEALTQLEMLDLFQGFQPDYHLNEVAIRHWDGYWFGKRRCLGDTFPHYWSALSGYAYREAMTITGAGQYAEKYERTLRGVLSLFKEDGSASCARVHPMSVNGRTAAFYDPWANDQDWGLYFILKWLSGMTCVIL